MKNIIYALEKDGLIYYVGKSTNLKRPYFHNKSHNKNLKEWILSLVNYPNVLILEQDVINLEERERYWINEMLKKSNPLFNISIPTERQLKFVEYQVGSFVKERRKVLKMTQKEFANKSGLGLRFVRDLEQGKETCRLDKVLTALSMFGATLIPVVK